jgi:hypothetical protein
MRSVPCGNEFDDTYDNDYYTMKDYHYDHLGYKLVCLKPIGEVKRLIPMRKGNDYPQVDDVDNKDGRDDKDSKVLSNSLVEIRDKAGVTGVLLTVILLVIEAVRVSVALCDETGEGGSCARGL